jgi:hypothetical protein
MKLRHAWSLAALVGLLAVSSAGSAPAPLNKTALAQVPAGAPVVVQVRGVEGTADRMIAFFKNALPDQAPIIELAIKQGLMAGLDGRQLKGLAKDGPHFFALLEMPKAGDTNPKAALIVSVTNYAEFRDGLLKPDEKKKLEKDKGGVEVTVLEDGQSIFFVDRKDVAIVTPNKDAALSFTKPQAGLDTKISPTLAGKLLASDIGVYLNLDIFNKQYAEQIKEGKKFIDEGLKAISDNLGKPERGQIDAVRKLIEPTFQALEDSQGLLFGLEFRPTALALHAETELRPGTATSKALKDSKPARFDTLGLLPAGNMFYTAAEYSPELMRVINSLALSSVDLDTKEGKALKAALEEVEKAPQRSKVEGMNLPPSGLQVWTARDPVKTLEAQLKVLEALSSGATFSSGIVKDKPEVKKDAQKYKDISFTSVKINFDLEKMAEAFGAGNEIPAALKKQIADGLKELLGESVHTWVGTDGKLGFQVTAKDWAGAQKILDGYFKEEKTLAGQAGFRTIRKDLPEEANFLLLVDLVRYASSIIELMKPLIQGQGVQIPANYPAALPKDRYSYMGFGVILTPERASLDLLISADSINDAYKAFVAPFIGN